MDEVARYNREAWNQQVAKGNPWTIPITPEQVEAARRGEWAIVLTATKTVPREWFGEISGKDILCLASGGGQQGPSLAAAGAKVTVLDNSPAQLERDRAVADANNLDITTVLGDMRDLSAFGNESFDLVFHPVSNLFSPEIRPVWREAYRVLRPGGALLTGFMNPDFYIFDTDKAEAGVYEVRHKLPYRDAESLDEAGRQRFLENGWALEHSHTMADQIGGQLDAGFVLTGLYEDADESPLGRYMPKYFATRAVKP